MGHSCSTNFVANVLRLQGLKAHNGKAFNYGSHAFTMHNVSENLLWRRFGASKPKKNGQRILPISGLKNSGSIWLR